MSHLSSVIPGNFSRHILTASSYPLHSYSQRNRVIGRIFLVSYISQTLIPYKQTNKNSTRLWTHTWAYSERLLQKRSVLFAGGLRTTILLCFCYLICEGCRVGTERMLHDRPLQIYPQSLVDSRAVLVQRCCLGRTGWTVRRVEAPGCALQPGLVHYH